MIHFMDREIDLIKPIDDSLQGISDSDTSYTLVHNSCYAIKKAFAAFFKTEDFLVGGILGSGYFATVVLVKHKPTNRFMALKISHDSVNLSKELDLLRILDHPNVLSYYGACVVAGRLSCALEFAEFGNLVSLLTDPAISLTWSDRIALASDIADGIKYLHDKSLIHRDLSSQNILIRFRKHFLDKDKKLKQSRLLDILYNTNKWPSLDTICHESFSLSPFDISTLKSSNFETKSPSVLLLCLLSSNRSDLLQKSEFKDSSCPFEAIVGDVGLVLDSSKRDIDLNRIEGNPFYTAPECLTGCAPYSLSSDVFSYGLLLCELISGLLNDGYRIPRLNSFALDHETLKALNGCPDWFFQLAKDCCELDYHSRPSIDQVIETIYKERNRDVETSCTQKNTSKLFMEESQIKIEAKSIDKPVSNPTLNLSEQATSSNSRKLQFPKRFTSFSIKNWRSKKKNYVRQITVADFQSSDSKESRDQEQFSQKNSKIFLLSVHSLDHSVIGDTPKAIKK